MKFIDLSPESAFDKAIESRLNDEKIVVCGPRENIEVIDESIELNFSPDTIIKDSLSINIQDWFDNQKQVMASEFEEELSEVEGEWPGEIQEKPGFMLDKDILTQKPVDDLVGALISVDACWKIPAVFNYGGWNDCPMPEIQCAIWRFWEEKYGAKIVGVGADIIEAFVEYPPTSQEEAMELAWQQYLYCYDIVDQGMESVANLAALLQNCQSWYFWWD